MEQESGPKSNPNTCWFTKFIQNFFCCCCNEIAMKDVSLRESLIACLDGESEPQPSNEPRPKQGSTKDNDFEGLKNIFAPSDITDDVIIVTSEVSRPRASFKCLKPSLGDMDEDPSAKCKALSSKSLGKNTISL